MKDLEKKLNKVIEAFKDAKPGSVTHVFIKHDLNCPALRTQNLNDCNCDPEINKGNDNDSTRL
jgi:hypothetical protein